MRLTLTLPSLLLSQPFVITYIKRLVIQMRLTYLQTHLFLVPLQHILRRRGGSGSENKFANVLLSIARARAASH